MSLLPIRIKNNFVENTLYILISILLLNSSNIKAQEDFSFVRPFWVNLSIGGSPEFMLGGSTEYFSYGWSFNKAFENFSYHIALNGAVEANHLLGGNEMTTGTVGVGIAKCKKWLISAIYIGPSVSYGEAENKSDNFINYWGAGIGVNAQLCFMPLYDGFGDIGLGLDITYNYNMLLTENVNYRHLFTIRLSGYITNLHELLKKQQLL